MGKEQCACDEHGRCGVCVMKELEPPPPRSIKNPNKAGICNCLDTPGNGFKYTAHELRNGEIVTVEYIKCDNCSLKLIDMSKVKPNKLETIEIVEVTPVKNLVWVKWCKKKCKTIEVKNN